MEKFLIDIKEVKNEFYKKIKYSFIIVLINIGNIYSQNITKKDSIRMLSTVTKLVESLESSNYEDFKKISTHNIYCLLCFDTPPDLNKKKPYEIRRKVFFNVFYYF